MTHRDIYIKFMIGYDKANVTSSYPSLTEYEIATFLDKAYLALIAQKVTGNNSRHIGFEQDLKLTEDLGPLVTTKRINTDINTSPIPYVSNALSCGKPNDWLYFVSGEMKRGLGDYEKTWDMQLITHDVASKFQTTAYNIPWIKHPVCYEEGSRIYVLYDSILQSANAGSNLSLSLTYIKKPKKFMVNDEPEIVIPGAPTVTSNYEDGQNVTLHIGDTFLIEYTNGNYGSVMAFSPRIIDTVTSETSTGGTIDCTAQYVGEGTLILKSTAHPTWQYSVNFTVVPNEGVTEEWTKSITGPDTILGSGSVTARYLANMVSNLYGFYNCEWTITPTSGLDGHLLSDYILYGSNGNSLTIDRLRNYTYDITVFIKAEPVGISDPSRKQAATVSKYVRITNEALQPELEQWYISFNPDTYNISQDNTIPLEAHMDSSLGNEDVPVFSITSGNLYARITNQHAGTYQQEATLEILPAAEGDDFPITITVRGTNHSEISENYYVYVQYTNNETPNPPTPTIWHFGDLLPAGLYGSGSEPQPSQSATLTTAPTAKSLTYNGSAQQLVNPGVASGGTLYYSLNGTDTTPTWSTSIPQLTNAGTYSVWYKVVGDSSHTDSPVYGPVLVTTGKKEVTLTWGNTTFVYDGSSHVPSVSVGGVMAGDSVSVSVSGDQTSIGTYTATASMTSQNYKLPSNYTCQFTIAATDNWALFSQFTAASPSGYYIMRGNVESFQLKTSHDEEVRERLYDDDGHLDMFNVIVYIDKTNNLIKVPLSSNSEWADGYRYDDTGNNVTSISLGRLHLRGYFAASAASKTLESYGLNMQYIADTISNLPYTEVLSNAPTISGWFYGELM